MRHGGKGGFTIFLESVMLMLYCLLLFHNVRLLLDRVYLSLAASFLQLLQLGFVDFVFPKLSCSNVGGF